MKSFFQRITRSAKPAAVSSRKANRVLSEAEILEQKAKLEAQRTAAAARIRASQQASVKGPRNRPKSKRDPNNDTKKSTRLFGRLRRKKVDPKIKAEKRKKNAIGPLIRDLLSGEFLTRQGVTQHIPYLIFVSGLFVAYIAMGYQFERIEREKVKTKQHLEELSAAFKTIQADFETRLQQSSVEKNIAALGLEQPTESPFLLEQRNQQQP